LHSGVFVMHFQFVIYIIDSLTQVTYTLISSNYEEPLDVGSLRVVVYGYDGLPMHPPSPNYVPGPEHPPSPAYVPKFVPEPVYQGFMPLEDDVLLAEEQPLPAADDEDPEEDLADYPTDRDDDEKDEEESFRDDAGDEEEDEDEEDEDEEEEHPAPADPIPPPPIHRTTARISILAQALYHFCLRADVFEVTLLPRKRLCIALSRRFEVGEISYAPTARPTRGFRVDYGFVGALDAEIRRDPDREIGYKITNVWEDPNKIAEEIPMTDVVELSQRMTDFVTTVRQDTDDIYGRLDDA
nr:hypothetical protein [Tanacetum cinerariifolium]